MLQNFQLQVQHDQFSLICDSRATQRGLCYEAGFWLIQVTLRLTLGFLYYKASSRLIRVNRHGNLCCSPNLLLSRLSSRLQISMCEPPTPPYSAINSPENSINIPGGSLGGLGRVGGCKVFQLCLKPLCFPDEHH